MLKSSLCLSFDDVHLEPQYSNVKSRANPDLSSRLSQSVVLSHPVIASNMASVVGANMILTLDQSGSIAIAHRFLNHNQLIILSDDLSGLINYFAFSIGIKDEDLVIASEMYQYWGEKAIILIDVAHAHTEKMPGFIHKVKNMGYNTVIAGNIATQSGFKLLQSAGADSVRVGIAGGKVCTTKNITGHFIPTLQSVLECAEVKTTASLIADGGIHTSGDAAKAIAAGADFVSLGSLLAATSDSPEELVEENGRLYKVHYGMSSQTAIDKFFPNKKTHVAAEGKHETIPYLGETDCVLKEFLAGLRSSLAYSGANNIKEFQEKAILRYKTS